MTQEQNLDSRAEDARCIRTLTFILSLAGRGNEGAGGQVRSSRFRTGEEFIDRPKNFLKLREHLVVPESKHPVTPLLKKRTADFIFARPLSMLRAVEFDDQASFDRAKVSEVWPDRELTAKLGAAHLTVAQVMPQDVFRVGLFATQPPRVPLGRFDRAHRIDCSRFGEETQPGRRIISSPCKGEDAGEGPYTASYFASESRFRSFRPHAAAPIT
jgi:hypothetical protein